MRLVSAVYLVPPPPRADRHRLAGTVTVDGTPARKRVVILLRGSCSLVSVRVSDPMTGAWQAVGLPEYAEGALTVIAFDDTGTYNAEVADYVSQVTGEGV